MKKHVYYEQTLEDLKENVEQETKDITALKKILKKLQEDGWEKTAPLENVIAELETRKKSVTGAINQLEVLTQPRK